MRYINLHLHPWGNVLLTDSIVVFTFGCNVSGKVDFSRSAKLLTDLGHEKSTDELIAERPLSPNEK